MVSYNNLLNDYNSKMDLTMRPYEVMIFKIGRNK